ncbi:MAG: phosphatidate cytidylyltransferase [Bdellovibrionales bacterium]|nr:phosphatidate cytidylyltransferase [Bdellovibrionales bacterium]
MSNTKARIISALIMAVLVALAVVFGKWTTLFAVLVAGVLCIDELLVNFAKISRQNNAYRTVVGFFTVLFVLINVMEARLTLGFFTIAAIFLNLFLIYYLFKIPRDKFFMKLSSDKNPTIVSFLVLLPLLSFGVHIHQEHWREVLGMLLIVTYSMDTGAWFVGKNFGKHKLWPAVSPKKTVEGLIGGMVIAGICGLYFWNSFFGESRWYYSIIFALCGVISQVGDLVQSKLKREFEIKDSSNLIPGHGGVYDRIDSLIFLSPFFVIVVKYLG